MGDRSRPDHWTRRAHDEGYAARSVFKLAELEERFHVIPRGGRVLDLGCSPGSWSAFVIKQAGPDRLQGETCHQFNGLSHSAPAFTEAVYLYSINTRHWTHLLTPTKPIYP